MNQVTKRLFAQYPNARAFATADILELEQDIKPTGFYRKKAETVKSVCENLVERFAGEVPVVLHGSYTCTAKNPKCSECILRNNCQFFANDK